MKKLRTCSVAASLVVCLGAAVPSLAATLRCPADSVPVGNVCIDRYEASVWEIDPANRSLINKVQQGKATLADLTRAGAIQASCTAGYPENFPPSGQWSPVDGSKPPSPGVYAVSIPGVRPSACVTWFQAAQACRLAGKRLLTNLEWQDAAAGTPDTVLGEDNGTTDCNLRSVFAVVDTGSRSSCKSSWGVFDMAGNVAEWVADWADNSRSSQCTDWTTSGAFPGEIPGGDRTCFGAPGGTGGDALPGALIRGGTFGSGGTGGVFAVDAGFEPSFRLPSVGFRCAR